MGGAQEELLYKSSEREIPEAWTKDGSILWGNFQGKKYFLLPLAGEREPRLVVQSDFTVDEPSVSPDGKWVAYGSTESGRYEVYTARFPEFTDRHQISPDSGAQPHWTQDGKQIIYLTMGGKLMAADVKLAGGSLETGVPRVLFETRIRTNGAVEQFAGILLAITPKAVRRPVAEAILTFIFALSKNLLEQDRLARSGGWRSNLTRLGRDVAGQAVGSVGCGNIARLGGRRYFRLMKATGIW